MFPSGVCVTACGEETHHHLSPRGPEGLLGRVEEQAEPQKDPAVERLAADTSAVPHLVCGCKDLHCPGGKPMASTQRTLDLEQGLTRDERTMHPVKLEKVPLCS
ncbi:hypothetical protein AAFF_G00092210 [Aldrovandia affinis]|uniref:Uncharacterized protein n=1 Tax=Aldrovandia affinis TaxID=143900 RepID=A0AAD7T2J6_9TELE|nr:hypothetical protein AAFF_G00092210 [Aldrovandia affinis]